MKKRFVTSLALAASLAISVGAQTVSVDAADGSPDNVTTFNSLMAAIRSFQADGAGGVGVNNGNGAPNVINITSTTPIEEIVGVTTSNPISTDQDEALTINGPGTGAPSAANNAVVRPQNSGIGSDGFVVVTNVDVTVNNVTFCSAVSGTATDDTLFLGSVAASPAAVATTFNSCVVTTSDASGEPVVNDKTEALADNTANIAIFGDDLMTIVVDPDNNTAISFNDCVLSHSRTGGDLIVEVANNGTPLRSGDFDLNIDSSVLSFAGRFGLQLAGDGDNVTLASGEVTQWQMSITGTNVDAGPVAGLGGPTVMINCVNHAMVSFLGTATGHATVDGVLNGNNGLRFWSSDADLQEVTFANVLAVWNGTDPVFVTDNWEDAVPQSFSNVTLVGSALWGDPTNGVEPVTGPTNTFSNVILAGDGANALGTLFSGDFNITFDDSALVLYGPHANVGSPNTGYTPGGNVSDADPGFVSLDVLSADYLDVQANAYAGAGPAGADLRGGGTYIGGVNTVPVELSVFSAN